MRWSSRHSILVAGVLLLVCALTMLRASVQQPQLPPPEASPGFTPVGPAATGPQPTPAQQPQLFVIIDPSHGGSDKGAVLGLKAVEKEITLAFARALRKELEEHEIQARLLRDLDTDISLERRAELCNQQRPALYIALHAGTPGQEVRVYAPLLPSAGPSLGSFQSWSAAQASSLERSNQVARVVTQELQKKHIKTQEMHAFLRPLNNVISPAIAVELGIDHNDSRLQESTRLREGIASALATAIEETRLQPGAQR